MTTFLRDQLQVARLNLMKARQRHAWAQRQREAEASEHPICEGCGKRHAPGLVGLLQALGRIDEDDAPPAPDKSHH